VCYKYAYLHIHLRNFFNVCLPNSETILHNGALPHRSTQNLYHKGQVFDAVWEIIAIYSVSRTKRNCGVIRNAENTVCVCVVKRLRRYFVVTTVR
jgi:hypothetical protein